VLDMPTPKKWNSLSNKLLPYWKIFAIISALSFLCTLVIVISQKNGNDIISIKNIPILLISSIIYMWSFGLLLVIAWFKKIQVYPEEPIGKYKFFKYKVRKFFEWYASIFLSIFWIFVVFISIFIFRYFIFS
ncbi:hypothetical protein, partial [Desulfatiferula olefinivorans]